VITIGHSVDGRPIKAFVIGDPRRPRPVLVVGCIHGDETAGIAVARRLVGQPATASTAFWIVPDLNPDGVALDTRQNAHGVDLNRNFPFRWLPLHARGEAQYQGPRPLSEPESRAIYNLITRLSPRLSIWFHQPLGVTDLSGGDPRVERQFARLAGLPVRQLVRYPGSATSWEDHAFPAATAFVVELPPGHLSQAATRGYADAVRALTAAATPTTKGLAAGVPARP
jgi:murein peptide amidase A